MSKGYAGMIWIAEKMGIKVELSAEINVDNAAGISFQQSNPQTKLKGISDMREKWIQELKPLKFRLKNLAAMQTKCSNVVARNVLEKELERIASDLTNSEKGY